MTDTFNFRKRQKNALFEVLMEEDWSPSDFSISNPAERQQKSDKEPRFVVQVIHLPTNGRFGLGWWKEETATTGPFAITYHPHSNKERQVLQVKEWVSVLNEFRSWLSALGEESEPDYWAEAERQRLVVPEILEEYNTPFASLEVTHVENSFNAALDELAQRQLLTASQLGELTALVSKQQLTAQSARRLDWLNAVASELIKWSMERIASSQAAKEIVDIIGSHFSWLTHQIGPTVEKVSGLLRGGGM